MCIFICILCIILHRLLLVIYITFLYVREPRIIQKPRRMSKAPDGEGCPRCDGHVYAAEQMLARGRVSNIHMKDFYCNNMCFTGIP